MKLTQAIVIAAQDSPAGEPSDLLVELAQRAIDSGIRPALVAMAVDLGRHREAARRIRAAKRAIEAARRAARMEGN